MTSLHGSRAHAWPGGRAKNSLGTFSGINNAAFGATSIVFAGRATMAAGGGVVRLPLSVPHLCFRACTVY
jgi:hypothetical protein